MNNQVRELHELTNPSRYDLIINGYVVCYNERKHAYTLPGGIIVSREEATRRYMNMINNNEVTNG